MLTLREELLLEHLKRAVKLGEALMLGEDWESVILRDCNELIEQVESEIHLNNIRKAGF